MVRIGCVNDMRKPPEKPDEDYALNIPNIVFVVAMILLAIGLWIMFDIHSYM